MSDHPNPPCPRCGSVFVPHRCGGILDGLAVRYALHTGLTVRPARYVPLDAVRDAVDVDTLIAGCRHADWCCTKGCVQPRGVHFEHLTGSIREVLCPGTCTCEVAPIVHQVVQQLTGGPDD